MTTSRLRTLFTKLLDEEIKKARSRVLKYDKARPFWFMHSVWKMNRRTLTRKLDTLLQRRAEWRLSEITPKKKRKRRKP